MISELLGNVTHEDDALRPGKVWKILCPPHVTHKDELPSGEGLEDLVKQEPDAGEVSVRATVQSHECSWKVDRTFGWIAWRSRLRS